MNFKQRVDKHNFKIAFIYSTDLAKIYQVSLADKTFKWAQALYETQLPDKYQIMRDIINYAFTGTADYLMNEIGYSYYEAHGGIMDKLRLLGFVSSCMYCNNNTEEPHFACDLCGRGMCDECYDMDTEHFRHYHQADTFSDERVVKAVGHEPDYLCDTCYDKIFLGGKNEF